MTDSRRGEKLRDLSAIPAKEILKNKARVCPPLSAVCEILDNIFDNFEENGSRHDLSISFVVKDDEGAGTLSIAENSGGIRESKLEPLVRLGVPYHAAKRSIGTWGEGFKVAAFSLGSEVEVLTSFPGEKPISILFQQGWLDSSDWNVPVYSLGDNPPRPGTTYFRISHLERRVDWAEVMREVAVIYGHKIDAIEATNKKVRLDFEINGNRAGVKPRALASVASLRQRLAFPPDFSPREFASEWPTDGGVVRCRLIVGLTARHSGETSGVYLYGNGRMFARALRTKAVGYGESGNAVLRDHPSCWRIHAYAFFEAEQGADIPWQAPLKDGVSENHPITTHFREFFKEAVAPYSRFAKIAKASELVPYTAEWEEMSSSQRAEVLFGKETHDALERFRKLPREVREFSPPQDLERLKFDGVACERMLGQLEEHAKYVRQVIAKRDKEGSGLEEEVLRALNPKAFSDERRTRGDASAHNPKHAVRIPRTTRILLQLRDVHLRRLRELFEIADDHKAVLAAIAYALRKLEGKGMRQASGKDR